MFVYISMWLLIDIEWVFGGKSKQFQVSFEYRLKFKRYI